MFSFIRIFFFISLTNYSVYMHIYNVSAPIFTYIYICMLRYRKSTCRHTPSLLFVLVYRRVLSRVSIRPATARYSVFSSCEQQKSDLHRDSCYDHSFVVHRSSCVSTINLKVSIFVVYITICIYK